MLYQNTLQLPSPMKLSQSDAPNMNVQLWVHLISFTLMSDIPKIAICDTCDTAFARDISPHGTGKPGKACASFVPRQTGSCVSGLVASANHRHLQKNSLVYHVFGGFHPE